MSSGVAQVNRQPIWRSCKKDGDGWGTHSENQLPTLPDSLYRGTPKGRGRGADLVTAGDVTWMPTSRDQVILGDNWKDSLGTGMAGEPLLMAYAPRGVVGVSK